jgi:hypothetical protein
MASIAEEMRFDSSHRKLFLLRSVKTDFGDQPTFARSNIGIVVSNPIQGMDVSLRFLLFLLGSGLATG